MRSFVVSFSSFDVASDSGQSGRGWDQAQRHGSQYLEIWESTDLVTWSNQRHVRVSDDTAGMTWAPEASYDPTIGAYVVYWATSPYAPTDVDHTGSTYPRMMYATTRDFRTFSKPQVWNDPGAGVIDSYFSEPRVGPDYNNISPDDPHGGQPMLGTPRAPVPPIPSTDAGVVAVNPPPGSGRDGSQPQPSPGLGTLLAPLTGGPS